MAEVAREHGWHPPKSFDSDKNFKPEHALLCRELRFIAIYAPFGDLWANYMVYIAYFTELILQICDYAQNRRIWRVNCNTRLTKNFTAIFAPDERLPSSATLLTILVSTWSLGFDRTPNPRQTLLRPLVSFKFLFSFIFRFPLLYIYLVSTRLQISSIWRFSSQETFYQSLCLSTMAPSQSTPLSLTGW